MHTPAAEIKEITGARTEHCASNKYGLMLLKALARDQNNGSRVAGRDGTTGLPVETKAMYMAEEDRQCTPPARIEQVGGRGEPLPVACAYCAQPGGGAEVGGPPEGIGGDTP